MTVAELEAQHDRMHADEALSELYDGGKPIDEKAVKALFRSPKNFGTDNVSFPPGQAGVFTGPHGEKMLIWKDMKSNFHVRMPMPEGQIFLDAPDKDGKCVCHEWKNGKDAILFKDTDQRTFVTKVNEKHDQQGNVHTTTFRTGLPQHEHLLLSPMEALRYRS